MQKSSKEIEGSALKRVSWQIAGIALLTACAWGGAAAPLFAQKEAKPTFGHSMQGDAFNTGPRRAAVLLPGIPSLEFPVTTKSPEAQKFMVQGVAQLHAYWYFEAERSFRQALALDPDCIMAYWGMARANVNNSVRAKEFAKLAYEKREGLTPREKAYIEALAVGVGLNEGKTEKKWQQRRDDYITALRKVAEAYPEDIEAKAFLGHELQERYSGEKESAETEKILQAVLAKNPMHPVHHYRIHLWDKPNNEKALDSAHLSGMSLPASAHMWHMEGHIYSQHRRYNDAAISQEASARVDHAQMQRTRILPDEIFNYAHNNQWLVENLVYTGRVQDALQVAKNLVANPRHPKYNTLERYASAGQGLSRLMEALETYQLWEESLQLWEAGYIEKTGNIEREKLRLTLLCGASYAVGAVSKGKQFAQELEEFLKKQKNTKSFDKALATTDFYAAHFGKNPVLAKRYLPKSNLGEEQKALYWLEYGENEKAVTAAQAGVKRYPNQVLPLAVLVRALYATGKKEEAKAEFDKLRPLAYRADLETPLLKPIMPIAQAFGYPADWRVAPPADSKAISRPPIETLGPLDWNPLPHPGLQLPDSNGTMISLEQYRGRNVIVLFYLGAACEKCMQQVNAFAAKKEEFAKAGIELVAVSLESPEALKAMLQEAEAQKKFTFPILSDPALNAFKAWGAYDDFEQMALHGTFFVDRAGKVCWMDTGFEPFTEADFVLKEAKRLLKLASPNVTTATPSPQ